jgi:nucleoside-diphosphate-sugar epimerase
VSGGETLFAGRRVVITGITGWLGLSLRHRLTGGFHAYDSTNLGHLSTLPKEPTVVFHLAFPRPGPRLVERAAAVSGLVEAFLDSIGAEVVFYPSSGAVIAPPPGREDYATAKRADEARFSAWAKRSGGRLIMPHLYCLSGRFIPESYVFATFVRAAVRATEALRVTPIKTIRSYLSVDDLWEFVLRGDCPDRFDGSGNEIIELGDLARRVRSVLSVDVPIQRRSRSGPGARYFGIPPCAWPTSLDDQIRQTAKWMSSDLMVKP